MFALVACLFESTVGPLYLGSFLSSSHELALLYAVLPTKQLNSRVQVVPQEV